MNAFVPFLSVLLLATGSALAQNGEEQEKVREEQRQHDRSPKPGHQDRDRQRAAADEKGSGNPADMAGVEGVTADGTNTTAGPASRDSLSNACSLQAMVSPRRLSPGETGTITLLLALQSRAVIQAEGVAWQVNYKPRQGPSGQLDIGQWQLRPAPLGTIEERYRGRPVYDNQALIDIPVTVAPGTPYGKQRFEADVEVPLTDGSTAQPMGLFRNHALLDIEIGAPMARPVVLGASPSRTGSAAKAPNASSAGPADTVNANPQASGRPANERAAEPRIAPIPAARGNGATEPAAVPPSDLEEPPGNSLPILPIGLGIGALLLLILVMSLRKK